jgi:hypothetical protein
VRVDLSIDVVNALLHAWTGNGLLADRVAHAGWTAQVDHELKAWTLLTLAGLRVERPPVVMAADQGKAGPEGGVGAELRRVCSSICAEGRPRGRWWRRGAGG